MTTPKNNKKIANEFLRSHSRAGAGGFTPPLYPVVRSFRSVLNVTI